jgi:hypothetical protein
MLVQILEDLKWCDCFIEKGKIINVELNDDDYMKYFLNEVIYKFYNENNEKRIIPASSLKILTKKEIREYKLKRILKD